MKFYKIVIDSDGIVKNVQEIKSVEDFESEKEKIFKLHEENKLLDPPFIDDRAIVYRYDINGDVEEVQIVAIDDQNIKEGV